jgi:hypothetical protein
MTSTALATSSAAYTRDLSQVASLSLEKPNPLQLDTEENKKDVPSKRYPETKEVGLFL